MRFANTFGWLIVLGLFIAQAVLRFPSPMVHDTAWFVHVAQGLLHGKKLYVDFIEVNPPLGMWLSVPPVWLAEKLTLDAIEIYYAMIFVLSAASLALCFRYQKLAEGKIDWPFRVAMTLAFLFFPAGNFSEREQFLYLFAAPWVMLRVLGPSPVVSIYERVGIGLLASLALGLKPQAALAPVCVEAVIYVQRRNWRELFSAENIAAAIGALGLLAIMWIATPEYFSLIVELGRRAYVPYLGLPTSLLVLNFFWAALFMAAALIQIGSFRARAFLAAAFGLAAAYILQNKGFSYQILPATVFAFLAATTHVIWDVPRRAAASFFAGFAALIMLVSAPQAYEGNQQLLQRAVAAGSNAKSVYVASTRLSDAFPAVVEMKLDYKSRYAHQWLIPYVAAHWEAGPVTDDPIVRRALQDAIDDLISGKPQMVLVDVSDTQAYLPKKTFDWLGFWSGDPRFATFWQDYERKATVDGHAVFVRK